MIKTNMLPVRARAPQKGLGARWRALGEKYDRAMRRIKGLPSQEEIAAALRQQEARRPQVPQRHQADDLDDSDPAVLMPALPDEDVALPPRIPEPRMIAAAREEAEEDPELQHVLGQRRRTLLGSVQGTINFFFGSDLEERNSVESLGRAAALTALTYVVISGALSVVWGLGNGAAHALVTESANTWQDLTEFGSGFKQAGGELFHDMWNYGLNTLTSLWDSVSTRIPFTQHPDTFTADIEWSQNIHELFDQGKADAGKFDALFKENGFGKPLFGNVDQMAPFKFGVFVYSAFKGFGYLKRRFIQEMEDFSLFSMEKTLSLARFISKKAIGIGVVLGAASFAVFAKEDTSVMELLTSIKNLVLPPALVYIVASQAEKLRTEGLPLWLNKLSAKGTGLAVAYGALSTAYTAFTGPGLASISFSTFLGNTLPWMIPCAAIYFATNFWLMRNVEKRSLIPRMSPREIITRVSAAVGGIGLATAAYLQGNSLLSTAVHGVVGAAVGALAVPAFLRFDRMEKKNQISTMVGIGGAALTFLVSGGSLVAAPIVGVGAYAATRIATHFIFKRQSGQNTPGDGSA